MTDAFALPYDATSKFSLALDNFYGNYITYAAPSNDIEIRVDAVDSNTFVASGGWVVQDLFDCVAVESVVVAGDFSASSMVLFLHISQGIISHRACCSEVTAAFDEVEGA